MRRHNEVSFLRRQHDAVETRDRILDFNGQRRQMNTVLGKG